MPAGVRDDDFVDDELRRVIDYGLLQVLAGRHVPYHSRHQLFHLEIKLLI